MGKAYLRFNVGDLVKFTHGHLGASAQKVGLITEQSYTSSKDNIYKIKTDKKEYWIPRSCIELLSSVVD